MDEFDQFDDAFSNDPDFDLRAADQEAEGRFEWGELTADAWERIQYYATGEGEPF